MRASFIARILKELLITPEHRDKPRADMYLPIGILILGIILAAGCIGCIIAYFITFMLPLLIAAPICAIIAIAAILCWKNQTINIIDDYRFEYTTFLGNKKVYNFSDVKSLRRNADSYTLFVKDDKVHIEAIAVLSDRLVDKINSIVE